MQRKRFFRRRLNKKEDPWNRRTNKRTTEKSYKAKPWKHSRSSDSDLQPPRPKRLHSTKMPTIQLQPPKSINIKQTIF